MFFSLIIPNYNNKRYLNKLFNSIYCQTFQDFEIIFVDDVSTDNSLAVARRWRDDHFKDKMKIVGLDEKKWNGGARNIGLEWRHMGSKYTLFIDSDDWFDNEKVFEDIYTTLAEYGYPDCLNLSYNWVGDETRLVELKRNTLEELTNDCNVACWTKCIKSDLLVKFPENTLMEDVAQHLAQVDILETVASYLKPVVNWNRQNKDSCSTNPNLQNGKWNSSLYRYYADLMDLQLTKSYTKNQRDTRLKDAIKI